MKVANKKPGHELRGVGNWKGVKLGSKFKGTTFMYPEGSPMRRYKDAKKVAKQK